MTTVYDSAQPRRPLYTEFRNFWNYRGLVKLLVSRDLTVRYKRSVLGMWWTLLNPLLTTAIMWLVFGALFGGRFGSDSEFPYVVYLLAGVLFMTFFAQGLLATASSITGASGILSKVYVPAEVFSFSTAIAAAVNFVFSLVPLVIVQLVSGTGIPWTVLLLPIPIVATLALASGLGMLVASVAVFFYDVMDLTRVGVQLLSYLTPVFWPEEIAGRFLPFVKANPLYSYITMFRHFMYQGTMPPWWIWTVVVTSSIGALGLGVWVFSRSWRNLVGRM